MNIFKEGDWVKCKDPGDRPLTMGKVYQITSVNGQFVSVKNDNENVCEYYPDRFIPDETWEVSQLLKEYDV
jgi:hypothetical protein